MVRPESAGAARRALGQMLLDAGVENGKNEGRWLTEALCGDKAPSPSQWDSLLALARRRAGGEPLQYILGRWPFLDFEVAVGPGVLIPRQDTEVLCLAARDLFTETGRAPGRIVDLCAGTGVIAMAMKRFFPAARVTALEKYDEAFAYLVKNAVPAGVEALQGDVFGFENTLAPASVDLLVSNPPYLTGDDMAALQKELTFEPAAALSGGADGLLFYRHIVPAYRPCLAPGGVLGVEIGAEQGPAVAALFAGAGYEAVALHRDLAGLPRCVTGRTPG